ncbi:MAG TPA: hypothetical protein VGN82_09250 [Bosea sp. (in: a-proteobacteria)]|jgi:hypothetical protein|uniref:hypothetical protein n=1 Tax=Bosea sp. (in: a-proteobacteria) TaxID=1871050 RepID=UPI002E162B7B|nr:hypothetical protein [Bosea sp. (in: a-proteobacteria)]
MIYICYGITKSASTFLYQLTEETFRAAGRPVVRLGPPLRPADSVENYFDFLTDPILESIQQAAAGRDVVLKTHGPPIGALARQIAAGTLLANASIRDPREIALSMLDHGDRSRQWRQHRFSEFAEVADTLNALDIQIGLFRSWAGIAGVRVFKYNDICFDSGAVVAAIAAQIGAAVEPDRVLRRFKSKTRIGQFSKGQALRYTEMSSEDQQIFLDRYAELYSEIDFETEGARLAAARQKGQTLRPSGEFFQHLINFRRRFRI